MKLKGRGRPSRAAALFRPTIVGLILVVAGAVVCPPTSAEVILRKDGRKMEGQIVREDDSYVTIQTTYGTFRIAKSQIASIEGRRAISQNEREGKEALAADDLDKALAKFQTALKEASQPDHRQAIEALIADVNKRLQEREEKRFASQLSTADRLIQEKRFADARAELKALLARNPEGSPAAKLIHKRISQVYMAEATAYKDTINYPEAADMYKKAIDELPDAAEPYLAMARFLAVREARPTETIDYYVKGIARALQTQKEADLLDDYYKLGCAYFKAGAVGKEPDEKLLREGIKCLLIVSRDGGTSYTALAATKLEDGFVLLGKTNYDTDAMIKMLDSTLAINPRAQKARWILAEIYSKKRDYPKVIGELLKIEANAKASGDLMPEELSYRLGLAYLAGPKPDYEKALQAFENEIRQNRLNYMALIKAAEIHSLNGTYDDALNYCDQAIALRKERPEAYLVSAEARMRRAMPDDIPQAQMYLRTALNLKSDFQPARIRLAEIDIMQQRRADQPNYQNALALLADALNDLSDPKEKLTDDDRKAKAEAILLQARIQDELRNPREAANLVKEALAVYPDIAAAYRLQGQLLLYVDNYDGARKSYLKAIELEPQTAETYLLLGKLCQNNLKAYDEAITYYQLYLKHQGSDKETVKRWIGECINSAGGTAPSTATTTATAAAVTAPSTATTTATAAAVTATSTATAPVAKAADAASTSTVRVPRKRAKVKP